jgi:hypothetical protein
MKFRLVYEGEIAPRQKMKVHDVHSIRVGLDPQLKHLWQFEPLVDFREKWLKSPDEAGNGIFEKRGAAIFVPVVSKRTFLQCELDIIFLRQQAAGQLIGEGGDIDNRVKTLLDALSVPPIAQQDIFRDGRGDPIFCLLQDDSLVTKISVETDRLLRPTTSEYDLVALIQVKISASRLTMGNIGIA